MPSSSQNSSRAKITAYRARLRAQGLRPVQVWVPDTRLPGFAQECRRQSRLAAAADAANPEANASLDAALTDLLNDGSE